MAGAVNPQLLRQLLQQHWGHSAFRPLQEEIINTVLRVEDALALLPTGGGKSLCYQLPAIVQEGCCLVISPLIALMEDQVGQLLGKNIPAAALHAGIKGTRLRYVIDNIKEGSFKLIYCSPERLQSRMFQELLPYLRISLIAVDEAHCISQWGHDFRPEYLQISFLKKRFPKIPMLALTASATPAVVEDIRKHLLIPDASIFQQSFERGNIFYDVRYTENKALDLRNAVAIANGSSIIYCRSRKHTESIAHQLKVEGIEAVHYHAGMKPEARMAAQESWMKGESPVIAATTAFGMGIDKADVRLIVHYDVPEDIESWYQETGRAGRDGAPATALTLYNQLDIKNLESSSKIQFPSVAYLREVYQAVVEYLQIPISAQPERYFPFEITDFCKKFSLKARNTAPALRLLSQEGFWTLSETVFHPPSVQFICPREDIDALNHRYPLLGAVAITLLRFYSGIFQFPVPVHIHTIAKKLRWKRADVEKALQQLSAMGMIIWEPVAEGPQLFFNSYRVDSHDLIIDTARLNALRDRHDARTSAMLQFLQNDKTCRGIAVLQYFGESKAENCGHCDYCRNLNSSAPSATELRTFILNALQTNESPIRMSILSSQLSQDSRPALIAALRDMAESGQILWHPDNSFSLSPKKSHRS